MTERAQSHRSDPRILGRRTVERDHRCLSRLLRPGLSVLDVGCGTGAITAGIAKAVGPQGRAVGVDRDTGLLDLARAEHGAAPNLEFEIGDAKSLAFSERFDIVTAARTLQWISEPGAAVRGMIQSAKPGGMVVILDYDHARNEWKPDPPVEFRKFYNAFLQWRAENGWDNEMAAHLPALFRSAGLVQVESEIQDEVTRRGEPDFDQQKTLWSAVIKNVGDRIAGAGFLTEVEVRDANESYEAWVETDLLSQTLSMRAVSGSRGVTG